MRKIYVVKDHEILKAAFLYRESAEEYVKSQDAINERTCKGCSSIIELYLYEYKASNEFPH